MRNVHAQIAGVAAMTALLLLFGATAAGADTTSGDDSVLGGNQADAPVNAPVTACGNAVLASEAECQSTYSSNGGDDGDDTTSGDGSIGGGNQVDANVNAPITVCGNAVGASGARCESHYGSGSGDDDPDGDRTTSGDDSVLGGNQLRLALNAPLSICGKPCSPLRPPAPSSPSSAGTTGTTTPQVTTASSAATRSSSP